MLIIYELSDSSSMRKMFAWAVDCLSSSSCWVDGSEHAYATFNTIFESLAFCLHMRQRQANNEQRMTNRRLFFVESRLRLVENHLRFIYRWSEWASSGRLIQRTRRKRKYFLFFSLTLFGQFIDARARCADTRCLRMTVGRTAIVAVCLRFRTTRYKSVHRLNSSIYSTRHSVGFFFTFPISE